MYKKRAGTSGISGQLYETRLVSLILFRLLHDDTIQEFHLASNMDDIGAFDDVCLRAKITGLERSLLVFIQAKHKEDDNSYLNYDLVKNFHDSLVRVKENFYASKSQSREVFFKGNFEDTECLFVLYTNVKFCDDTNIGAATTEANPSPSLKHARKPYQGNFAKKLSHLISTGEGNSQGSQADFTEKDLEIASEKILQDEITTLAEHFATFLNDQSMNILLDKYMVLYHVILAQKVVHVSEVRTEEVMSKKRKVKKNEQKPANVSKIKSKQNNDGQRSLNISDKNEQVEISDNIPQENKAGENQVALNTDKLSDSKWEINKSDQSEQTIKTKSEKNKHKETVIQNSKAKPEKSQQILDFKSKETKPKQEQEENKPEPEVRKYRHLTFRRDFIFTEDKNLVILRDKIIQIIVNNQFKNKKKQKAKTKNDGAMSSINDTIEKQISEFLSEPSATTLSPLIGTCIIYNNDNLKFIIGRPDSDLEKLERINSSQAGLSLIVDEAEIIAAKNILLSLELKVPATFGNIDLTIAGDSAKVEKRLNTLVELMDKLCQKSITVDLYNIVTIDKSVGESFLSLTGGLGSAVSNLLVYDKTSKLLKFTEDYKSLEINARVLYDKLISRDNIASKFNSYRFDTKAITNFPKLEFDYTQEAKTIFNKVVVYEKQSNHNGVEKLLREEIERHQNTSAPYNLSLLPEKIAIYYHNEIQKWWMSKTGKLFTKAENVYEKAVNNIFIEPHISAMQTTSYMNNINYFRYDFNEKAMTSIASLERHSRAIIVTDIPSLTTVKVTKYFMNKEKHNYAVLDLECLLYLPNKDFTALTLELKHTTKVLILVCDSPKNSRLLYKVLDELAEVMADKRIIVIIRKAFVKMAYEYFEQVDIILNDEGQSLIDFTRESMKDIIEKSSIIFQGVNVSLNCLVDDKSAAYVKGAVLNKIISSETVEVGTSLSNANYEEMRYLYVERKVHLAPIDNNNVPYDYIAEYDDEAPESKGRLLRRFEDINEDVVLITAAPGMGKSTLLTHLSLNKKTFDGGVWIVRTNLLDHSKTFHNWQTQKQDINVVETLKLLCQVILRNNNLQICLKEIFEEVYLDGSTGDEMADFELNMFLHFYNERQLLFLFDGFDEICPHYKEKVINFFSVVMNYPKKHKMWVTSRPYSEILPDLQRVLGKSYEMEYIDDNDQTIYLKKYWRKHIIIKKLNEVQLRKVTSFIDYTNIRYNEPSTTAICSIFFDYVRWYFPHFSQNKKLKISIPMALNPHLTDLKGGFVRRRMDIVMGTPLLLYLYANYFVNLICGEEVTVNWKLNLEASLLTVYEMFVETKLKILFQDKNEMDIYRPTILTKYLKNYAECLTLHKRLAAYTLFFHRIHIDELKDLHPFKGEGEYEAVINEIKCGTEKIGLISHVSADNIAVFVYKTLEEYFANEFLCDIFKSKDIDLTRKSLLYSIAHVTFGIFPWLSRRKAIDEELREALNEIVRKRFYTADLFGYLFATGWPIEQLIRLRSSTAEDYEPGFFVKDNTHVIKELRPLNEEQRNVKIKEFQVNVISKMKPHLKQYFTVSPENDTGQASSPS